MVDHALANKRAILAAHPLFAGLDAAVMQRLALVAVTQKIKAGTTLFRKDDPGSCLYAICSGSVRIIVPSEQGKEAVLNSIEAGEIFGEIALLDGGPRTADAVVAEDAEVMILERRNFTGLMRDQPDLALRVIEVLCARLRRTSEQVEDAHFLGMPSRLAKTLLRLAERTATAGPATVRSTQREISQMIGTSRESTNKQLREWEQRQWLKLDRGTIVIVAPDQLRRMVSEEAAG
jgi:CRP/FNR family transcriptional regulator, cyclic AMP receptor protein